MNEQKFQLELERFRQKASWENKIFYVILGFLVSVILFYIQQGEVGENCFWGWVMVLGLVLILGELAVNCYLKKVKKEIWDKI